MLHFNNAANGVTIRGLKFRHPAATTRLEASTMVYMCTAGANVRVQNCDITGVAYGVWDSNGNSIWIKDSRVYDIHTDGIHIGGNSQNFNIIRNKVFNTKDGMIAITTDGTDGNTTVRAGYGVVSENVLNNHNGTAGNSVALYNVGEVTVCNNSMQDMQGNGVSIHTYRADSPPAGIDGLCTGIVAAENNAHQVGSAQSDPDGNPYSTEQGHGHGIYIEGGIDIRTYANALKANSQSPNPWQAGIALNAVSTALIDITMKDDVISDHNGNAINGFGSWGADGIVFDGTTIFDVTSFTTNLSTLSFTGYVAFKNMTARDMGGNLSLYLDAGSTSIAIDIVGNTFPSTQSANLGGLAAATIRKDANLPAF